jgi:hypothetical protein
VLGPASFSESSPVSTPQLGGTSAERLPSGVSMRLYPGAGATSGGAAVFFGAPSGFGCGCFPASLPSSVGLGVDSSGCVVSTAPAGFSPRFAVWGGSPSLRRRVRAATEPMPSISAKTTPIPTMSTGVMFLLEAVAAGGGGTCLGICCVGTASAAFGDTLAPHTMQNLSPACTMLPHRVQ